MKRSKFTEEQIAYALRQVEAGTPAGRRLPAARRQRSHVLHLEEEVRAPGRERAAPAAAARGRERAAEAPGRRPLARQTHPDGGAAKKSLRPTQRRELAAWVQSTFAVSCVRACHLAQFSRAAWYRRVDARGPGAAAVAHPGARARAAAVRVHAHLGAAPTRRLAGEQEARASALSARRACSCACGSGGASTSPCIAAPRRSRPGPRSAGAWTSCTMRWPMAARFGC